jgi:diguanylate cyclase (GGDEF)-like protein
MVDGAHPQAETSADRIAELLSVVSSLEHEAEKNARRLAMVRERQTLLERLSRIQRSIVTHLPLDEVLDRIVTGAAELLGDEVVALSLVDADSPGEIVMVASTGITVEADDAARRGRIGDGIAGRAIAERRLVTDDGSSHGASVASTATARRAAVAAPIRERGEVVGSLVVASRDPGRRYSAVEREMLLAFADHAGLALTDARTVGDAMHQAMHDSLTGLPNRALLLDRLEQALARAARSGAGVGVLFCDLDAFKAVNDSLGHAAGDELLVAVARRLVGSVRPGDTAARFGGDEFVFLLEGISDDDVGGAAQRILDSFEKPFTVRDRDVFVNASIGIAIGHDEADDLLHNADLALYRAKEKGRGRYELFQPEIHAAAQAPTDGQTLGVDRS